MASVSTPMALALGVTMPIVNTIIVGLRLYARQKRTKIGADDLFAVVALIFTLICNSILAYGSVNYGYGKHSANKTAEQGFTDSSMFLEETKQISWYLCFLTPLGLGAAKLSMVLFYRRIFRGRWFNALSWCLIALSAAWCTTFFFTAILQCGTHSSVLWTSAKLAAEFCLPGEPIALAETSIDLFLDACIIVLPVFWLSRLKLHASRKILVMVVFFFGLLAMIASLARLVVFDVQYPLHNHNPDQLSYATWVSYFRCFELGLAVIAICLPTLSGLMSDRRRGHLVSWINSMLPVRLRTASKQRSSSIHMSKTVTRRGKAFPDDDLFRGEPYAIVESFATVEPKALEATSKRGEGAITVTTSTTQVSRQAFQGTETRSSSEEEVVPHAIG